jgi:H+-translocating NAD(P) transhydrogenase subunit alpha
MVRIVVPAEIVPGERRVAVVPEVVSLYADLGLKVVVQSGAGRHALATDEAFAKAGAEVVDAVEASTVDILLHVRPLNPAVVKKLRQGAVTVGICAPPAHLAAVRALRDRKITSFAPDLVPRIARAQAVDVLSSQALVAGHRCVLEAAVRLPRLFPLSMTAAGTLPAAKVLVLGAGVAGLQAIATAKRLGAVVAAYDVRSATVEEVRSVGGTFVDLDLAPVESPGGYAGVRSPAQANRQQELLTPHVAEADVLITTASVPGRPAPRLVTKSMLAKMRPGSVVVDLSAEAGGNVEGARPGDEVEVEVAGGTVRVLGLKDAASGAPVDASRLYARNLAELLLLMTKDGELAPDFDDEIIGGACLTHDGVVRHGPTAALLRGGV